MAVIERLAEVRFVLVDFDHATFRFEAASDGLVEIDTREASVFER